MKWNWEDSGRTCQFPVQILKYVLSKTDALQLWAEGKCQTYRLVSAQLAVPLLGLDRR